MIEKEELRRATETIRAIFNMLKNDEDTQENCEILKAKMNSLPSVIRPMVRDPEQGSVVNLASFMGFTYPFKQEFFKCIVEHSPYTLFQDHADQMSIAEIYHENGTNLSSLPKAILPLKVAISKRNLQMTTSILSSSAFQTDRYAPLADRAIFLIENICYGIFSYYQTNAPIEDQILVAMNDAVCKFVQESGRIGCSCIIDKLKSQIIPDFETLYQKRESELMRNIDQKVIMFLNALEVAFEEGKAEAHERGV